MDKIKIKFYSTLIIIFQTGKTLKNRYIFDNANSDFKVILYIIDCT